MSRQIALNSPSVGGHPSFVRPCSQKAMPRRNCSPVIVPSSRAQALPVAPNGSSPKLDVHLDPKTSAILNQITETAFIGKCAGGFVLAGDCADSVSGTRPRFGVCDWSDMDTSL